MYVELSTPEMIVTFLGVIFGGVLYPSSWKGLTLGEQHMLFFTFVNYFTKVSSNTGHNKRNSKTKTTPCDSSFDSKRVFALEV